MSYTPTYSFIPGTPAKAAEVNQNFTDINSANFADKGAAGTFTAKQTYTVSTDADLSITPGAAPTTGLAAGDLYVNSPDNHLYIYDGASFQKIPYLSDIATITEASNLNITGDWNFNGGKMGVPSGATDPVAGMQTADIFYNTTTSLLKYYDGAIWQEVGAGAGAGLAKYLQSFTLQTSVTVTHNLVDSNPIVQVYDSNNELITPDVIDITDANNVALTFNVATTGFVVVHGGINLTSGGVATYLHTQVASSATWTVTHNLNDFNPVVFVFDSTGDVVEPQSIEITDENSFDVKFAAAGTGKVRVLAGKFRGGTGDGNFLPTIDANYNIGSAPLQWKNLFLSGDISLGGLLLANNAGVLEWNGSPVGPTADAESLEDVAGTWAIKSHIPVHFLAPLYDSVIAGAPSLLQSASYFLNHQLYLALQNDGVSYSVFLPRGTYTLRMIHNTWSGRGQLHCTIDATDHGFIEGYSAGNVENVTSDLTGIVITTSKLHTVDFETLTKNASASAYSFHFACFTFIKTA